jgi:aminoglycoside 3-N-acetyltransferase
MEMLMGVPYRYTKEFSHPIVQENGRIENELFYMFVWYRGVDLARNINVKIFEHYHKRGYPLAQARLGSGLVYGYRCADFCESTANYLKKDIYGWLTHPPKERPYTK